MKTNFDFKLMLPRLCFAAEIDKYRKEHRVLNYNGLIVLEANNLADYDEAIKIRNIAARLPQTMMAFLGASGRSVKIVCRGAGETTGSLRQGLTEELQPRKGGQQSGLQPRKGGQQSGQPPFQFRVRTQAQRQLLPVGGGVGSFILEVYLDSLIRVWRSQARGRVRMRVSRAVGQ